MEKINKAISWQMKDANEKLKEDTERANRILTKMYTTTKALKNAAEEIKQILNK